MWLQEWKKDVKALEAEVRAIKLKLRNDWSVSYNYAAGRYPSNDQFHMHELKFKLTHLYQYRAANRGKLHVEKLPIKTWGLVLPDLSKYDELKKKSIVGAFKDVDSTVLVSAQPMKRADGTTVFRGDKDAPPPGPISIKPQGFLTALKNFFS